MTVLEFEAWVSDNYEALLNVSERVCHGRREEGTELLHQLIEHIVERGELSADNPWAWMVHALQMDAFDLLRVREAEQRRLAEFTTNFITLGPDLLQNREAEKHAARERKRSGVRSRLRLSDDSPMSPAQKKAKKHRDKKRAEQHNALAANWLTGQCGSTRWSYQQDRDSVLFEARAIKSLAASIRTSSRRHVHRGELGVAYSEFGRERG